MRLNDISIRYPGERYRRTGMGGYATFDQHGTLVNQDGNPYHMTFNAMTRDDWEVVEDEVIKAGDEIVLNQQVGAFKEGTVCDVTETCPNEMPIGRIKVQPRVDFYLGEAQYSLVRKGPKVHTFEGVQLEWSPGGHVPIIRAKSEERLRVNALTGIKAYDLTLTERPDA